LAAGLFVCGVARAGTVVYSHDFEQGVGKEWSSEKVEETPENGRHYLGGFTTDRVTFKLEKLPRHALVRVSLKLYVMGTWDGNAQAGQAGQGGARVGPDVWRMTMGEGAAERTLVDATFSNLDFAVGSVTRPATTQSYPSVLRGESYGARTGSAERNTLGFEWASNDGTSLAVDTVYQLTFTVPHEGAELTLAFQGAEGLAPMDDETWGLDDVKVETLEKGEARPSDSAEMRRLWEAVGGRDVVTEAEAFWRLVAGGDDAARFLRAKVKGAGVDRKVFRRLVAELSSEEFATRERATAGLRAMGPAAEGLLRDEVGRAASGEVKQRLEGVLKWIGSAPPNDPEARRFAIAIKLLRVIGTAEAEKAIRELSGGESRPQR
jgi:hypothetical protein